MFQKAQKTRAYLRMGIQGPSGSGKTFTALSLARPLTDKRVALIDSEHGSASKYSDIFDFDVMELDAPFHPDKYVEGIQGAANMGYGVVIVDSLSHAWNGKGGLLEIVDQIAARMRTSNTFAAWKDATPIQNRLVDSIVGTPIHIIGTFRTKTEYVLEQVERNGKTVTQPRKVGMAAVQRDSFEYEMDVVGEMDLDHNLIITKTRCSAIVDAVVNKPGEELAATLRGWLTDGVEDPNEPKRQRITELLNALAAMDTTGDDLDVTKGAVRVRDDRGQAHRLDGAIKALEDMQNRLTNGKKETVEV